MFTLSRQAKYCYSFTFLISVSLTCSFLRQTTFLDIWTGLSMVVESSSYIVLDPFLGTALLLREDPELFSLLLYFLYLDPASPSTNSRAGPWRESCEMIEGEPLNLRRRSIWRPWSFLTLSFQVEGAPRCEWWGAQGCHRWGAWGVVGLAVGARGSRGAELGQTWYISCFLGHCC